MKQSQLEVGMRFGNLITKSRCYERDTKGHYSWSCQCDCGRIHHATANNLLRGIVHACPSCAAKKRSAHRIKPHRKHRVRGVYFTMVARCHNENSTSYERYGALGVKVCDRWRESLDNFIDDMGLPKKGESIDRIDPRKGYCKKNCRWASNETQANNKRDIKKYTMNGKAQSLAQWCRELNLDYNRVKARINVYGMPFKKAISRGKLNKKHEYTTPDGVFHSLQEVADHYGMSISGVSSKFKSQYQPEWTKTG